MRNGTRNADRSWSPILLDVDDDRRWSLLNWSLRINRVPVCVDLRSILRLGWSNWLAVGIYLRSYSITRLLVRNLIAPLVDGALR